MILKRDLIIPDVHCPNHDKRALRLVEKVGQQFEFDTVICLGDLIDNEPLGRHPKTYKKKLDYSADVKSARAVRARLEALAPKRIITLGNHDEWFNKYFAERAPEFNLDENNIAKLLGLDNWTVIPYKKYYKHGKVYISHDFERCGKYAAQQVLADVQNSVYFGHTHRLVAAYEGDVFGNRHVSANFGWLGDVNKITYKHMLKAKREWQLGFGICYREPNGVCHTQLVPIIAYKCVVEGVLFKA